MAIHVYMSNCSFDQNEIRSEGGMALGEALNFNHTLQTLR